MRCRDRSIAGWQTARECPQVEEEILGVVGGGRVEGTGLGMAPSRRLRLLLPLLLLLLPRAEVGPAEERISHDSQGEEAGKGHSHWLSNALPELKATGTIVAEPGIPAKPVGLQLLFRPPPRLRHLLRRRRRRLSVSQQ